MKNSAYKDSAVVTTIASQNTFLRDIKVDIKKWNTTIFDISGFPHYENVMSNIYAYFLDPTQNHGLGNLFIDALQSILGSSYSFDHVEIRREYTVTDQKRIDILIVNKSEENNQAIKQVIIIENKMFHLLNNDLDKYYDFFNIPTDDKRGVVLTLQPLTVHHERYQNVTHRQWIDKIESMKDSYAIDISEDTEHMLKQFFQNLDNYTMNRDMKGHFNLITQHHEKIKAIEETKKQLDKHIWDQIQNVNAHVKDLNLEVEIRKGAGLAYCFSRDATKASDVFFTFLPAIKWQEKPAISIVVELKNKGLTMKDEIDKLPFSDEEIKVIHTLNEQQVNEGYLHYASEVYYVTDQEIDNLSKYIADSIKKGPLLSVYKRIIDEIHEEEKTPDTHEKPNSNK